MEREVLEQYLQAGFSLERIGELEGKHPSTIGYWVKKHGLTNPRSAKHTGRGGLPRVDLEHFVEDGLTLRQIALLTDRSLATVRYWMRRYGLETRYALWARDPDQKPRELKRRCRHHGTTTFVKDSRGHYRCPPCQVERVSEWRRRVKELLVAEAGGACAVCGYDRHPRALEFHHLDPETKAFGLGSGNSFSLATARAEAAKCALLCGNCHAEVEAGVLTLRLPRAAA
jgi:transposase